MALSGTLTGAVITPYIADATSTPPGPDAPQAQPRGDSHIELPPLNTGSGTPLPPAASTGEGAAGVPATALDAYRRAESAVAASKPGCHLPWALVAGIGRVESVHASGYGLRADGTTERPIRGPRLDGTQFALIKDTDGGKWDGDREYDRAVGPTQFIPSTWATWGADGNGDGVRDPNNIYDAALATGLYLCAGNRDLTRAADLDAAVLSYNNSRAYVTAVLSWMRQYQNSGATPVTNPTVVPTSAGPTRPRTPEARPVTPTTPSTPSALKPTSTPTPTLTPPRPTPTPTLTPARLERVGEEQIEAQEGTVFSARPQVKARLSDGTMAVGRNVVFTIIGDTGARFAGRTIRAVALTDKDGIATAPNLNSVGQAGRFTLRASLDQLPAVDFDATVRPAPAPVADQLTVTSQAPLQVETGQALTGPVIVRATANGQPVRGTVATLHLPDATTEGPYVLDPDGHHVRTLALAPSDADGTITLPTLHAGTHPGTYKMALTTAEGITLTLHLTVLTDLGTAKRGAPQ